MKDIAIMLVTAAISTAGFSILFYVHPKRLFLATLGGVLTTAAYLFAGHFLGGELIPNLLGALIGAGFSEIMARVTRVPVPVYMVPSVIPLVPGSALYATMFNFVSGQYDLAADAALTTLEVALGVAGGIVVVSVLGLFIHPGRRPKGRSAD